MKPRYRQPRIPFKYISQQLEEYSFQIRGGEVVLHECPQGWAELGMPRTSRNMRKLNQHFRFRYGVALTALPRGVSV